MVHPDDAESLRLYDGAARRTGSYAAARIGPQGVYADARPADVGTDRADRQQPDRCLPARWRGGYHRAVLAAAGAYGDWRNARRVAGGSRYVRRLDERL